jgi:hypothetical protein
MEANGKVLGEKESSLAEVKEKKLGIKGTRKYIYP